MNLICPPEYLALTPSDKAHICNGCGPADDWKAKLVPNVLMGVDFTEACNVHDFMYWQGKDKDEADVYLLANMTAACIEHCKEDGDGMFRFEALMFAAHLFFSAVHSCGHPYFGRPR